MNDYENSYLKKIKSKRSPDDLFIPKERGFSFLATGTLVLIVLLLSIIAYLLTRDNVVIDNISVSPRAEYEKKESVNRSRKEVKMVSNSKRDNEKDTATTNQLAPDGSSDQMLKITEESLKSTRKSGASMTDSDMAKIAQLVVAQLKKNKDLDANMEASLREDEAKAAQKDKISHYNKLVVNANASTTEQALTDLYKKTSGSKKKSSYIKATARELNTRKKEMRFHTVKSNETLSSISLEVYGDMKYYTKIFEANPDVLRSAHLIHVGQKLRIPE